MNTKTSVLIVTRDRVSLLSEALNSLIAAAEKAHASFEFVVVINGLDSVTKAYLRECHPKVILLEIDETNPGAARNKGVQVCSGDWIYFADDDITVDEEFFDRFQFIRLANPEFKIIGGPNLSPINSSFFQSVSGDALGSPLASFHCANRYRLAKIERDCDDSKLILCNLFVSADAITASPFPPDFICAEENFALAKWRKSGARSLYTPDLAVSHCRRPNASSFFRQTLKYGRGRGRLIAAGEFRWFHLVPSVCLTVLCTLLAGAVLGSWNFHAALQVLALYLALVSLEAFRLSRSFDLRRVSVLALSIAIVHFGYAIGVLTGLLYDHVITELPQTAFPARLIEWISIKIRRA